MMSSMINASGGISRFAKNDDHEFFSALILAGQLRLAHTHSDRICFQTTYLNEKYIEYFQMKGNHKLIWMLRNPHSVVYSMCYNWGHYALIELFEGCGLVNANQVDRFRYRVFGRRGVNRFRMACHAYVGKVAQLLELNARLAEPAFVVDYDQLTQRSHTILPEVYEYLDLVYQDQYAAQVHKHSVAKSAELSPEQARLVDRICGPVYRSALELVSHA